MKLIEKLRLKAYTEAMAKLAKAPHKCVIIRPTGFGKTGILTKIIKSGVYKHILYLYPTEVIKNTVLDFYHGRNSTEVTIPGVTFMTYMALTNLSDTTLESLKATDLIICDECHRLGATETMRGMKAIQAACPNAHLVGATATPERMDMIDEIAIFFDDICISKYTLHDAFQDGVLQVPYYTFCAYGQTDVDILADLDKDDMLRTAELDPDEREYAKELIKGRLIEVAELARMDYTIKQVLRETNTDTTYQKYIVFFGNFARMRESKAAVRSWFESAFPRHTITELIISSENSEYENNVNKLPTMTYKKNHIDLIYACEMLNMGYHVSDLTGIMMYRTTYSNIIYSQQFGRVLSSGDSLPKLVFDVVDNLHRKSIYTMLGDKCHANMTEDEIAEYQALVRRTRDKDEYGNPIPLTEEETARFLELGKLFKSYNDEKIGKTGANTIYQEDLQLITTAYTATHREIIAKTVAELISIKCRLAWARWIEKGGDTSVMTREYILGQKAPQAVPLPPFCRLKNVSVNAVLNEMGIA